MWAPILLFYIKIENVQTKAFWNFLDNEGRNLATSKQIRRQQINKEIGNKQNGSTISCFLFDPRTLVEHNDGVALIASIRVNEVEEAAVSFSQSKLSNIFERLFIIRLCLAGIFSVLYA